MDVFDVYLLKIDEKGYAPPMEGKGKANTLIHKGDIQFKNLPKEKSILTTAVEIQKALN
ncbi:MAG: hypothetical protein ABIM43_05430 [candidate division WOR-3 bacterium]